jgi:hypothetical protein
MGWTADLWFLCNDLDLEAVRVLKPARVMIASSSVRVALVRPGRLRLCSVPERFGEVVIVRYDPSVFHVTPSLHAAS